MKPKKPKFPKRVVLGTGYPFIVQKEDDGFVDRAVGLRIDSWSGSYLDLHVPTCVTSDKAPPYRLVLERVDGKGK